MKHLQYSLANAKVTSVFTKKGMAVESRRKLFRLQELENC